MMNARMTRPICPLPTFTVSLPIISKLFIIYHLSFPNVRFVQDIPHPQFPQFRIGLYAWNGKYIVKIEAGPYEQTYKISEMDLLAPDAVPTLLDSEFLTRVADRFRAMAADWQATGERNKVF